MPDSLTQTLTPAMKRHLRELAEISETAAWHPESPGEWRCAEALESRGLLQRHVSRGEKPFSLTPAGYEIGFKLWEEWCLDG